MSHTLHSWWCKAGYKKRCFYNLYKMRPKQLHCSPPNIWLKQQEKRIWMFDFCQQNKFCVVAMSWNDKDGNVKKYSQMFSCPNVEIINVSGEWFCGWLVLFVCQNSWMVAGRKWSSNILCRNFCIFFRHRLDTLHQFKICPDIVGFPQNFQTVSHKSLSLSNRSRNILRSRWEIHSPRGPRCADWQSVTDKNGASFSHGRHLQISAIEKDRAPKGNKIAPSFGALEKVGAIKSFPSLPRERGGVERGLLNKLWVF